MKTEPLKVTLKVKKSFWLIPCLYVINLASHYRFITLSAAAHAMGWLSGRAFKYRIGDGKWIRLRERFTFSLERQ